MSANQDGGPAFPITPVGTGDPRDGMSTGSSGMSLRDWFAGQESLNDFDEVTGQSIKAIGELLAGPFPSDSLDQIKWEAEWRAALKFIRADAMLKAREQ